MILQISSSCIVQWIVKSKFGSGELSKKNFERLPWRLKEQSCKKSHMRELQYQYIPMRTNCENSPGLQCYFYSQMHHATGSQT
jgi:hypothetical protein